MLKRLVVLALVMGGAVSLPGQQAGWKGGPGRTTLELWPNGAPGRSYAVGPEGDTSTAKSETVAGRPVIRLGNVSVPTLTLYSPQGKNTGAAVVVYPGGGYRTLSIDMEGTEACGWLNAEGIVCLLLKYRVPGSGPYPKSDAALQDAQRAMGMVREHAAEWGIDPKRVGVLGFSAGAHMAVMLSTHYEQRLYPVVDAADRMSCRPDFAMVIYPGYLVQAEKGFTFTPDVPVTAQTPPAFLVQAENDPVHVENSIAYFLALKGAGVPAEMHIYAKGRHGYGLRRTADPVTAWPEQADVWLRTIGVVPGAAK